MANLREVTDILLFLAALYPRYELPASTIRAYATIFEDIPTDLLRQAAIHVGSRNTFFPSAAELRAAVFELSEKAHGLPAAGEAWAEVCRQFSLGFSRYKPPTDDDWSHPLVKSALDAIGGWRYLCDSENFAADRARFLQIYDTLVHRAQDDTRMLPQVRATVEQLAAGDDGQGKLAETIKTLAARLRPNT